MAKIVWTPAGSVMGLGTVLLERPLKPLTLDQYRAALSSKIDRMVQAEGQEQAADLMSRTVEVAEGLSVARRPDQAGDVLVWESEELANKSGMLTQNWPVPPRKIRAEPVSPPPILEEFLDNLYPDLP